MATTLAQTIRGMDPETTKLVGTLQSDAELKPLRDALGNDRAALSALANFISGVAQDWAIKLAEAIDNNQRY